MMGARGGGRSGAGCRLAGAGAPVGSLAAPGAPGHKRQDKDDGLWHRAFQLPLPWERGQHKCFWDRFLELNLAPMGHQGPWQRLPFRASMRPLRRAVER